LPAVDAQNAKGVVMNTPVAPQSLKSIKLNLPTRRSAFYGGQWREPKGGKSVEQINPGTGESLGSARRSAATNSPVSGARSVWRN
jgi:hypothetical protein